MDGFSHNRGRSSLERPAPRGECHAKWTHASVKIDVQSWGEALAKVIVIGAGIGGLACAIELAAAGTAVTVVEAAARPGGKMRETLIDGVGVDSGPTVFTMRWVFEALFAAAGARLEDCLGLVPAERLARHAWADGSTLDLHGELGRSIEAIGDFAGAAEAAGYRAFCAEGAAIHDTLRDTYLMAQQTTPLGLARRVGLGRLGALMAIRPFETLWDALGRHFRDPRLRQLFGRYATYCGASPFAGPATLMLIAHVEREGVWIIEGGMQRLAEALEALARSLGVDFRYGVPATAIDVAAGRCAGVTLADGERLAAPFVVANADPQALASGAFGAAAAAATDARPASNRSLSAVTWAMVARPAGFDLARHNVFFSGDYRAEFDDILGAGRLPANPTVYVCAQDREAATAPSPDGERLFVLVNAPAQGDRGRPDEAEIRACERRTFDHLARLGLAVSRTEGRTRVCAPDDFHRAFPATGGALYGPAIHGPTATFQRPGARTRLPGLYLAGGGVHPGAGIPMAALSGRLAAWRLMTDRGSTRPWRRGAMSGGTSTP